MRGVHAGGRVKRDLLLQPRDLRVRQDGEDLVRRRGHVHCDAAVRERGGDALRLRVRVPAQLEPEVVFHRGGELHAEQAALGEHGAVALHRAAEARLERVVDDDHCLAEEQAVFRAADVKRIAQPRQILRLQVAARGRERLRQPRAVEIQVHPVRVARRAQGGQLRHGIDSAEFRRVGHVHHARQHHVLVIHARRSAVLRGGVGDGGGGELAVRAGHGDHLVAGGLDRAGLVHIDVAGVGRDHGLPRAQEGGRGELVRLRAADEEVHVGVRAGEAGADGVGRAAAVVVEPVARRGAEVGVAQGAQHVRVRTLGVIVLKAEHGGSPFVWTGFGTLRVPLRLIIAPAAGACQCGAAFSVATPRRMQSGFFLVRGKKKAGSFRCRPARQCRVSPVTTCTRRQVGRLSAVSLLPTSNRHLSAGREACNPQRKFWHPL